MRNFLLLAILFSFSLTAQEPGTAEYKIAVVDGHIEAVPPTAAQMPANYTFFKTATTCQPDSVECIIPVDFDTWERVAFTGGSICSGNNGWSSDDCSSDEIPLNFEYSVCGEAFNSLWINTNGNLTFDQPNDVYTAAGIPNTNAVMVAPFWADVDFGGTCGEVWIHNTPTSFIATWIEVGYFSSSCDLLNTFQVVITDGNDPLIGIGNNTAFYYCDMNWTTGDASDGVGGLGGFPAVVGINSGNLDAFAIIGNFDDAGLVYDGPLGANDGVDFLDNKFYLFDSNNCAIESSCSIFDLDVTPTACDGDLYDLEISFTPAGVGPNGFIVDLEGEILGPFGYGPLGEVTSVVIEGLTGFGQTNIAIDVFDLDDSSCITDCFFDAPVCAPVDCTSDAGVMPVGPLYVCSGNPVFSVTSGQVLDTDDVLNYALHTSPTSTPGDILDVNSTGQFSIGSADTETAYYISAIVGNDSGDGTVDLGDPCLSVAAGTEVVFLNPVELDIVEQCDNTVGELSLIVSVNGGLPGYTGSTSYTVTGLPGAAALTLALGEQVVVGVGSFDGQVYSASASDANSCSVTVTSDPVDCVKLPIELSSFVGTEEAKGNLINWTTATELDNDYFKLEYSTNGSDFIELTRINGAGTSLTENDYSYLHDQAQEGTTYYRLIQVDFNGAWTRSDIIAVTRSQAVVSAYDMSINNPVQEVMNIDFGAEASGTISVYDISGRLVYVEQVQNQMQKNVELGSLSKGVYFVEFASAGNRSVKKFLKQ